MTHQDYKYMKPDLLMRLWRYKNRNEIKEKYLYVSIYGIVHTLIKTNEGVVSFVSTKFPDGQYPHEMFGIKIEGVR